MNKLTNQGYFVSRLKNSGYSILRLDVPYSDIDPRAWTIIINPGSANIFCTCYVNANKDSIKESFFGDNYFELHDGGQYLPSKFKLSTSSIEVVVTYLIENGIIGSTNNVNNNNNE